MTPYPTDQITVADAIRAIRAPVTITYDHTTALPRWRVEVGDVVVLDQSLGMALFQAATMWRTHQETPRGCR